MKRKRNRKRKRKRKEMRWQIIRFKSQIGHLLIIYYYLLFNK